jgi:hypothetical protein
MLSAFGRDISPELAIGANMSVALLPKVQQDASALCVHPKGHDEHQATTAIVF